MTATALYIAAGLLAIIAGAMVAAPLGVAVAAVVCGVAGFLLDEVNTDAPD